MVNIMPQTAVLADLRDADLRDCLDDWTSSLWDWDNAQRSNVLNNSCEGPIVGVILSAGMAEAERRLTALRQEAESRPSLRDEMRERRA